MWKSGCLHGLDLDVTSTGPRKKYLDLDFWMSDLDFWMSGGPKSGCLDFLDLDAAVPGPVGKYKGFTYGNILVGQYQGLPMG